MKKYIIPFLFLIMTFIMLPKQAFYKKGDINVKIELTDSSLAYFYLGETKEACLKDYVYYFSGNGFNQNIKNSAIHKSIIHIYSGKGYIKSIKLDDKKIEIPDNLKVYEFNWKKLHKFYEFNLLTLFLYLGLCMGLVFCFFKKGIELSENNFVSFIFGSYILSIAINQTYSNKILAILLSLAFLKVIFEPKRLEFGKVEILSGALLCLAFLSERFSYGNYEQMYASFQNSFLLILVLKIFKLDIFNKNDLKSYFKYSSILVMVVNIVAPTPLGGIYIFTFGIFAILLFLNSFREILKYKNLENKDLVLNILQIFLGMYGLIYSQRRTMLLVLLVYVIYLSVSYLIKNNKKGINVLILFCFILMAGFKLVDFKNENKFINRVKSIFTIKGNESNYQRVLMWRRGGYIFLENPSFGIGIDSFYEESIKEKYNEIKHKDEKFIKIFNHVHNEYIHQLISRGIFGALIFFGLWIYILKNIKKSEDKEFDIMMLILYGVYGIFDSYSIRIDSVFLYIFIGVTFANNIIINEVRNKLTEKIGYISIVGVFLTALYFNKRFRYYFLIFLVLYLIYYLYKKRKREKI